MNHHVRMCCMCCMCLYDFGMATISSKSCKDLAGKPSHAPKHPNALVPVDLAILAETEESHETFEISADSHIYPKVQDA